ncbi:hypothetical protein [Burkholderia sp. GS2Y]|uniref:Flp pilus-assembly TadG-like N-terminal domain-containing protein n=1 Tax=Burkholderia theae TaxID=3143496 RepID=A0ABU9WQ99_9BURK
MKRYDWVWPLSVLALIVVAAWIGRIDVNCGFEMTTVSTTFICRTPQTSASGTPVVKRDTNEGGNRWFAKFSEDPVEIFTFVLAVSTVLLWWDTNGLRRLGNRQSIDMRKSLEVAERAADAAIAANQLNRDSFAIEYRPWVSVKIDVAGPLTWDVNGANATFRFSLSNTGRTPAQGVWVHPRFAVSGGANRDPKEIQSEIIRSAIGNPFAIGTTVFPNETYVLSISLTIPDVEVIQFIDELKGRGVAADFDYFPACLAGCVVYGSTFDNKPHYTGFVYDVQKRDMPTAARTMLKNGENLIQPELQIEDRGFLYQAAIAT